MAVSLDPPFSDREQQCLAEIQRLRRIVSLVPVEYEKSSNDLYERSSASHAETRKLIIGLSSGSLAVFYATLTDRDVPELDSDIKLLLGLAIAAMAVAVLAGVIAWWLDAQWAYEKARKIQDDKEYRTSISEIIRAKSALHDQKNNFDLIMTSGFFIGITLITARIIEIVI